MPPHGVGHKAHLILFIHKNTGKIKRVQTASSFPVAQIGDTCVQVRYMIEFAQDYDKAEKQLYRMLRRPSSQWLHRYMSNEDLREMYEA